MSSLEPDNPPILFAKTIYNPSRERPCSFYNAYTVIIINDKNIRNFLFVKWNIVTYIRTHINVIVLVLLLLLLQINQYFSHGHKPEAGREIQTELNRRRIRDDKG